MHKERILVFQPTDQASEILQPCLESTSPFNILAEVELAQAHLDSEGNVPSNVREYIRLNLQTQLLEATTKTIHTTHQLWDKDVKELSGYGFSMRDLAQSGIRNAQAAIASYGSDYIFELDRRLVEAHQIEEITASISSGQFNDHDRIVISPYPEEADETAAGEIGYFTDTRVFMLRMYSFNEETNILTTTQIQLEKSDLPLLNALAAELTQEQDISSTTTQILATIIFAPKGIYDVTDLAFMYDQLLERKHKHTHFLGVPAHRKNQYEEIREKTAQAEKDTSPIIEGLVETDIEIAKSLNTHTPTPHVICLIERALEAKSASGLHIIEDQSKRNTLVYANTVFTKEAAIILKDYEMKKAYILVKSLTEQEEAEEIFGKSQVQTVRGQFYNGVIEELLHRQLSHMGSDAEFVIRFCGGSIINTGRNFTNAFDLPYSTFRDMVSGGSERKFVKNCGKCGKEINDVISKGYKCTCGGVYEGC